MRSWLISFEATLNVIVKATYKSSDVTNSNDDDDNNAVNSHDSANFRSMLKQTHSTVVFEEMMLRRASVVSDVHSRRTSTDNYNNHDNNNKNSKDHDGKFDDEKSKGDVSIRTGK